MDELRRATRTTRIEGLDVLRGFAVLLVIAGHALPTPFRAGALVGVILFFTLSGYLITGVLMKDLGLYGKIRYGRFYRNRALRLIPALLLMLLGLSIVTLVADPLGDRGGLLRGIVVAITYTANIPFDHGSTAIAHLWTLATEEQFYLVWPIILAMGLKFRRLSTFVAAAAIAVLVACLGSIAVASDDLTKIYALPSSWAITMVIGAAARLGQDRLAKVLPQRGWGRPALTGVALGIVLSLCFVPSPSNQAASYLVGGPLVATLTVILIFHFRTWQRVPSVSLRPLLSLGTVSYAAYLWNYPIAMWVGTHDSQVLPAATSVVLTLAAAGLSWLLVERPIQAWRTRMDAKAASASQPTAACV